MKSGKLKSALMIFSNMASLLRLRDERKEWRRKCEERRECQRMELIFDK